MSEAPGSAALDPERAKTIYAGLPDPAKAEVASLMSQGMLGRHAVARVLSQHKQNLARESVDAERLTTEPSAAERFGATALGAADTATFGQAGRIRGALNVPTGMVQGMSPGDAYDEGKAAVDAYENDERLNPSFKVGRSAAMLASAAAPVRGAVTAVEDLAAGGIANTKGSTIVDVARALAKPLSRVPGDATALGLRAVKAVPPKIRQALSALVGEGGVNEDIVDTAAVPKAMPEWMSSLVGDEAVAQPSGLALARPPPMPKPVPRAPRAPKATVATHAEPMAAEAAPTPDVRERALSDLMKQDVTPFVQQLPLAPSGAQPMSAQSLKDVVRTAVAKGEPLKALAKRLKVPQGDIAAYFKAAQIGKL